MNQENTPIKKRRRLKRWVYNALFIISGAVIGEVVALLAKNVSFLSWLSHTVNLGFTTPIELDLIVMNFKFGFYFVLCPALVLFVVLALVVGNLFLMENRPKPVKTDVSDIEDDIEDDEQ